MSNFKVSIIMPVYNAATYVERAVESAINLPETGEIILVDDASTDQSLIVCKQLAARYNNVRLLEHPDKKNHGASGSRNLGMMNAGCSYISFLDADDYYLPNRFEVEKEIFESDETLDGVYGCTLAVYESDNARQIFLKGNFAERTTFSKVIPPEGLFEALIFGGYGCFHTSGLTFKKKLLEKTGLFNPAIRYVEDTELWYKFSLLGRLAAGSISEPVAIRWVHDTNSIHQIDKIKPYRQKMYQEVFTWAMKRNFPFDVKNAFFIALHTCTYDHKKNQAKLLLLQAAKIPSMLLSAFFYKKMKLIFFRK